MKTRRGYRFVASVSPPLNGDADIGKFLEFGSLLLSIGGCIFHVGGLVFSDRFSR